MKISNEAKVGILAIAAIVVLVLGFNFLKGQKVFKETPAIYAVFTHLGTLEKSNQVKINGLPIGTINDYKPSDKEVTSIIVEIHLSREIAIPKNSIAFIDGSPLGSSFINIKKGDANIYLKPGDTISTDLSQGLLGDIKTQLAPTVTRVNETLDSLKLAIGSINSVFDPTTRYNVQKMISHLAQSSADLQRVMDAETGALSHTLANMNSVSTNLARNNASINRTISNVETASNKLASARVEEVVQQLEGTIAELKNAAQGLRGSIDRINSTDGTLGALVNDRKLYDRLNSSALALEILLDDVRMHPKRYVNISVFGGKTGSQPLTSPAVKDSVPRRK